MTRTIAMKATAAGAGNPIVQGGGTTRGMSEVPVVAPIEPYSTILYGVPIIEAPGSLTKASARDDAPQSTGSRVLARRDLPKYSIAITPINGEATGGGNENSKFEDSRQRHEEKAERESTIYIRLYTMICQTPASGPGAANGSGREV
jgi:hypothetical protein